MPKKKKKNPNRKPMTKGERERHVRDSALTTVWAIFFTVLFDKEGHSVEDMQRIWKECEYLSDSIAKGRVNVADLLRTLADEYGVVLTD